jgi:hypothetical protein
MALATLTLGEPLTQDSIPNRAHGKMLALSFLIGLGCAVFLFRGTQTPVLEPSISMAAQPLQLGSIQPRMLPGRASKILASLPGNPALKHKVVRAIEETNGRCMPRDVFTRAEAGEAPLSKEKVMDMAGVSAPLGFFDPLGISTNVPEGRLLFFREAELKHGRVCMLAILGLIVGDRHDFFPILGGGIDKDVPAYLLGTPLIMQTSAAQFWKVALAGIFFEEYRRNYYNKQDVLGGTQPSAPAPGDYGWDPLGLKPKNAKDLKELQTKELNNGRLAMFAAAGWIAQEQATGNKIWPFLQ